jgi:hypothetical protein
VPKASGFEVLRDNLDADSNATWKIAVDKAAVAHKKLRSVPD